MKYLIPALLIFIILNNCKTPNSKDNSDSIDTQKAEIKPNKTRLEQVTEKPFRNLHVNETLKSSLIEKALELKNQLDSLNQIVLYYQSQDARFKKVEMNWENSKDAINYSYDLWSDKYITMTIVGYPSFSENVETGEQTNIYVFQIEHNSLTGTCCLFIDQTDNEEHISFNYYERN